MKKAYGFVEMIGLASAVVAADTALKAANVKLDGLEPAKGQGMHTLKLTGEVSAVQAAVSSILGNKVLQGKVYSHTVIARPSDGLELMIEGMDELMRKEDKTKAQKDKEKSGKPKSETEASHHEKETVSPEGMDTDEKSEEPQKEELSEEAHENEEASDEESSEEEEESAPIEPGQSSTTTVQAPMEEAVVQIEKSGTAKKKKTVTCNLCGDPLCQRVKGEPRVKCIHYKEKE
ncbi:MAG TPA: BMC domain-containing protein [Proteiniclasticum sp.]|nr:BMC domain-containing protein [Proteiniclasticum sp.]